MCRRTMSRQRATLRHAAASSVAIIATTASAARAQPQQVAEFEITGWFASPRITESSGVAVSRRHSGILWTHNDSGDEPVVYATDLRGRDLGWFRVPGARAEDWEDISIGTCPGQGETRDCLYIADTGDNLEARPEVAIYVVPEPDPWKGGQGSRETVPARAIRIRYPDGPQDTEALTVAPSRRLWLITKGRQGNPSIYAIPDDLNSDLITARKLHTLDWNNADGPSHWVTAAAMSPTGRVLALRTYAAVHLFALQSGDDRPAEITSCWIGNRQILGEAVDFLNESALVLTSESVRDQPGSIGRAKCVTSSEQMR